MVKDKLGAKPADNLHLFKVRDDSMSPAFLDRDLVLLDANQSKPTSDHLFVVRIRNEYMLRRIERQDSKIKFMANDELSSDRVLPEDSDDFEIIGRVIWFCRDI